MAREFKVFKVPTADPLSWQDELNRYLQSRRVVAVDKHYEGEAWHFCVESHASPEAEPGGPAKAGRVDYKEILSPEDFGRYLNLRQWRKEKSASQNIPAYSIFTNAQLADLVRLPSPDKSALGGVSGIGEKRVEQYGEEILTLLKDEKSGETVSTDH